MSAAIGRSPWNTWMVTLVCRSAAVVKISLFLTGIGVLRAMRAVAIPPSVSTPSVSGVTSTRTMPPTAPASTPAWIAAPAATHSIGSTPISALRPQMSSKNVRTAGMRVGPPTNTMRSNVGGLDAGVLQRLLDGSAAAFDHRPHQPLELGAREIHLEMARRAAGRRDVRQADVRGDVVGELDLRELAGLPQPRRRLQVVAQLDAGLLAEAVGETIEDALVHVGAAQPRVAARCLDLEHAFAEFHDRDIERAAAQVDHRDAQLLAQPVQSVGERGGRGLVHQPRHLQARNAARVLGGRALVVVEIRGHGHHRLVHRLAEEGLGIALDLLQQEGGELLGRELAIAQADFLALAHPALERGGGAFRIGARLAPRRLADEHLPVRGQRHVAREGLAAERDALGAGDDDGPASAQHGSGGIGGAEIDADDRHVNVPSVARQLSIDSGALHLAGRPGRRRKRRHSRLHQALEVPVRRPDQFVMRSGVESNLLVGSK